MSFYAVSIARRSRPLRSRSQLRGVLPASCCQPREPAQKEGLGGPEADRIREEARRKAKEEAERARYLDQLAAREAAVWNDVFAFIQHRQPKGYDQAIRLLIDLRDLAIRQGHETEVRARIENLRVKHAAKSRFIERLTKAVF
jgi:hypothetical protein